MELKTLKELEIDSAYAEVDEKVVQVKKLRLEAIKWIKLFLKNFPKLSFSDVTPIGIENGVFVLKTKVFEDNSVFHETIGIIAWIKHFFNIIEEDLK